MAHTKLNLVLDGSKIKSLYLQLVKVEQNLHMMHLKIIFIHGMDILKNSGFPIKPVDTMEQAAKDVVAMVKEKK